MKTIKFSIIVPIYNASEYLEKCLTSIIKQTYRNIEIILINDGSTDNSLNICKKFALLDKRIIIINQKNMGVSKSRNVGIKQAIGKYTIFIDSDDWIDLNTIETCHKILSKYDFDLLIFPYIREYKKSSKLRKIFPYEFEFKNKLKIQKNILRKLVGPLPYELQNPIDIETNNAVWGKVYKTNLIKTIEFLDFKNIISEDLLFNISYIKKISSIKYFENIAYHYNKENINSLTKIDFDNIILRWKNLYENINIQINDSNILLNKSDLENCLNNRVIINILTITLQIYKNSTNYYQMLKNLKLLLNNEMYVNKFNFNIIKNMKIHWKVFYLLCKFKCVILLSILLFFINLLKKKGC